MSPSTPRRSGAAEICGFATPEGLVKPWQGLAEFGARTQMVEPITSLLDPQCSDDAVRSLSRARGRAQCHPGVRARRAG